VQDAPNPDRIFVGLLDPAIPTAAYEAKVRSLDAAYTASPAAPAGVLTGTEQQKHYTPSPPLPS
jgi:hypothetical protein